MKSMNHRVGLASPVALALLLITGVSAQSTPATESDVGALRASVEALRAEVQAARVAGDQAQQRVRELEAQLGDRDGTAMETAVREIGAKLPAIQARRDAALTVSGYFDTDFRIDHAGNTKDTFDQHRLVLKLDSDLAGPLSFRSEIEIEGGGVITGSGNYLSGNQILVEFAEAHVALSDSLNMKIGSLLIPFGRYNYEHDSPLQELADRPLVNRRLIPTTWNDSGIGIYGAFHPEFATIDYDFVLINGLTEKINAIDGTRNARASFRKDNNDNKTVAGRIGMNFDVSWLEALGLGVSGMCGKYDDENQQTATMLGFDWRLRKGPFELLGEYAKLNLDRGPGEMTTSVTTNVPGGMDGWYAELRYHFFPESWRADDGLLGPRSTFCATLRYDSIDSDTGTTAVDFASRGDAYRDDRRRLTCGLSFRPVQQSVFKLEYQWFPEHSGIASVDNDRIVFSFATYF